MNDRRQFLEFIKNMKAVREDIKLFKSQLLKLRQLSRGLSGLQLQENTINIKTKEFNIMRSEKDLSILKEDLYNLIGDFKFEDFEKEVRTHYAKISKKVDGWLGW